MVRKGRVLALAVGFAVSSLVAVGGHAHADGSSYVGVAPDAELDSAVKASERPVVAFTPGEDVTIAVGRTLTFDGSGSSDPDGGELRFQWRSTGVPKVASWESTYSRTFDTAGRFLVKLTVVNGARKRASKAIWVTVGDNQRPVASFTPNKDLTIDVGEPLTFDGSGSSDPDGDVLQYQWRSTGVRGVVSRESSYSRTFDTPGRFVVKLTVVDTGFQRSTESIWVTVQGPPVVEVTTNKNVFFYYEEIHLTVDFPFVLNASKSFDPDGGPLRYEWKFVDTESGTSQVMSRDARYADTFDFFTFWTWDPDRLVLTVTDDEGFQTTYEKTFVLGHFD